MPGASPCFPAKLPACAGVHGGHYSAKSSSKLCPFFPCPCVIFPGCWRVSPWPCWVPPQQPCSAALQKTSAIRGAHNITAAGGVPLPCWEGAKTFLKVCLCRNYPNHNERLSFATFPTTQEANAITLHTPLALDLPEESILEPEEASDETLVERETRNIGCTVRLDVGTGRCIQFTVKAIRNLPHHLETLLIPTYTTWKLPSDPKLRL